MACKLAAHGRFRPGSLVAAVAALCVLAGAVRAQPLFERVEKDRPTLDAWWNVWLYEQSPRAVLSPNMFGDFIPNNPLTTNLGTAGGLPAALSNPVAGGLVGRTKVSYDNNPMPRDRLIANFDFLDNAPLRLPQGHDVNRFNLGFEKTIFDSQASIALLVPFGTTVTSSAEEGVINGRGTQAGNLLLILKGLVMSTDDMSVSAGVGWSFPTASDTRLRLGGADVVRVSNDAVIATPFVAVLFTPSDRFFAQAWTAFGFDLSGNRVTVTPPGGGGAAVGGRPDRLNDPTSLQLDFQVGYWLCHPTAEPWGALTGLAPFLEFHYNGTLTDPDSITRAGVTVSDPNGGYESSSLTYGLLMEFCNDMYLTLGLTTPLRNGPNRFSDLDFGVHFTWFFGATADARSRALGTF